MVVVIMPNSNTNQLFKEKPQLPRVSNEDLKEKSADAIEKTDLINDAIQRHKNPTRSKIESVVKSLTSALAKSTHNTQEVKEILAQII